MAEPFIGMIIQVGFNYAPRDWALCNGQLMSLSQNTALFSLLGTYYGGDGKATFALPDLRGSASIHQGSGAGLSPRSIGEIGGETAVTLVTSEMPAHNHIPNAFNSANQTLPNDMIWGGDSSGSYAIYSSASPNTLLNPITAIGTAGGGQAHNNMQPYLAVTFCIALEGIYPLRS